MAKNTKLRYVYKVDRNSYSRTSHIIKKPQSLFGKSFIDVVYFKINKTNWGWTRCNREQKLY